MRRVAGFTFAILLAAATFVAAPARADADLEQVLVESATTPAQHAALARYYQGKAEAASREAARHRAMAKSYGGAKAADVAKMREHCEKLVATYDEQATQFGSLAKEHEALAK